MGAAHCSELVQEAWERRVYAAAAGWYGLLRKRGVPGDSVQMRPSMYYCTRALVRCCHQAMSGLLGEVRIWITPVYVTGGLVRISSHFLISACESANEKPHAPL